MTERIPIRREISAGCVVYRRRGREIEVALIRPKGHDRWALPKGLIDSGETTEQAAARETHEETGLTGTIRDRIDTIKYTYTAKWETPPARVFKIVTFFLMEATGGDIAKHQWEVDRVEWFPIEDAVRAASFRTEREIIRKAGGMLGQRRV